MGSTQHTTNHDKPRQPREGGTKAGNQLCHDTTYNEVKGKQGDGGKPTQKKEGGRAQKGKKCRKNNVEA